MLSIERGWGRVQAAFDRATLVAAKTETPDEKTQIYERRGREYLRLENESDSLADLTVYRRRLSRRSFVLRSAPDKPTPLDRITVSGRGTKVKAEGWVDKIDVSQKAKAWVRFFGSEAKASTRGKLRIDDQVVVLKAESRGEIRVNGSIMGIAEIIGGDLRADHVEDLRMGSTDPNGLSTAVIERGISQLQVDGNTKVKTGGHIGILGGSGRNSNVTTTRVNLNAYEGDGLQLKETHSEK